MNEDAKAEYVDEKEGGDEVPDEVSRCKGLDHAASTGISPYAPLPVHGLALLVSVHAPQRQDVDEGALEQRDDMCVPARPFPSVGRILLGRVLHREPWRDDEVDEGVHEGSEENLVYVLGQHSEMEPLREGPDPFAERRDGRYEEGILHDYGAAEAFELDIWDGSADQCWQAAVGGAAVAARTQRAGRNL